VRKSRKKEGREKGGKKEYYLLEGGEGILPMVSGESTERKR